MKKLLLILLCLMLLVGCTLFKKDPKEPIINNGGQINQREPNELGEKYLKKLKEFKVRERNKDNNIDNEEFNIFLDNIFKEIVESSYLYMHSSVVDYKALGLTKPEPSFGEISYKNPDIEDTERQLNELLKFDYNSLSYSQQYDYNLLEYSLYESLANAAYDIYAFLYGSSVDILSSFMTQLTDFVFHNKEEVDDYIILIKDAKRYLLDIKKFTEDQIADGLYMSDNSVENSLELLSRTLSKIEDNALITSFDDRIDDLEFLNAQEKEEYKKENKDIVLNEIIPALEETESFLEAQKGKVQDISSLALCNIDPSYAETVYLLKGSYNLPMDEIYEQVSDFYDEALLKYLEGYFNGSGEIYSDMKENPEGVFTYDARGMLDYLKEKANKYYPELGDIEYDVDEIDASTASSSVLAYYWPAPLDNLNQNIIRTNPNNLSNNSIEAYTTLAHEGFPGHLYQHVYYQKTNPHKFRNTQSFIGYTEGYAVRAQNDALAFGEIHEDVDDYLIDYISYETSYYFLLFSKFDIGINYYGWDITKIEEELEEAGLSKQAANEILKILIDMPGVYCSYGLGYTYFTNLRKYAKDKLGDKFNMVEYNDVILKCGDSPFILVKDVLDDYIANK